MPRTKREKSRTGIYHVIFRGFKEQEIFKDDQDYYKFIQTLKDVKKLSGCELYGYCLISNHIHLLIKEGQESMATMFRRIGVRYVNWYNWKYQRRGQLFQDRYKCEAVQSSGCFISVLRHIHMNPVKAKLVHSPEGYEYSSYVEYTKIPRLCDVRNGLEAFHYSQHRARILFKEYHMEENRDRCMEYDRGVRWKDDEAAEYIAEHFGLKMPKKIQQLDGTKRNEILKACREEGISIRQLERLTGVSYGLIRKIETVR